MARFGRLRSVSLFLLVLAGGLGTSWELVLAGGNPPTGDWEGAGGTQSSGYTITALTGPAAYSSAWAINNNGVVVGSASMDEQNSRSGVVRWTAGVPDILDIPEFILVWPTSIADDGSIAAFGTDGNDAYALVHANGQWSVLPSLGFGQSYAWDVADDGTVVGHAYGADGVAKAVKWQQGVISELWTGPGNSYLSEAHGVDGSGQIVGGYVDSNGIDYHAVLFGNDAPTVLSCPNGGSSWANGISSTGVVAGACAGVGAYHPTKWVGGQPVVLDPTRLGEAWNVNDHGDAVGYILDPGERGALFTGDAVIDLNTLLPPDSGWVLGRARGINNHGAIVGDGLLNGVPTAFLLTPIANTSVGTDVSVSTSIELPGGEPATTTVTFSTVTAAGDSTVTASETGPALPAGFQLPEPPLYFDVSTTATFTGTVALCFSWTEGTLQNEANARLLHFENGAWVDVTTSVDTQANIVCGNVTSLSPFVIAELAYQLPGFGPPLLSDGSASIQQTKAGRTIPVKFQLRFNGQLTGAATATIAVYRILNVATGTVDTTDLTEDAGAANENSDRFRFDAAGQQYIYNLNTKGWSAPATYRIVVTLDDGATFTVDFSLR